jgi:hypothetical protein
MLAPGSDITLQFSQLSTVAVSLVFVFFREDKIGERLKHYPGTTTTTTRNNNTANVHSNAHKVIAGFFLSPDPEVT